MRKSSRLKQNQAYNENDAQMEPVIKRSRSENKASYIATLDNGTMVEALKYLGYMQLAKSSLVAKRFSNLIRTHRHSLALLDVERIYMDLNLDRGHSLIPNAAIIIFNNELNPEAYTEWIDHNNYSKQIIHEGRVAKMKRRQYGRHFYEMRAHYRDSNQSPNGTTITVFSARKQLNHKYWPLFQHFVRLLSDPFVYIRYLKLIPQIDVYFLNLLSGAISPYHDRLQCGQLDFQGVQLGTFWWNIHKGNVQKLLGWIKNHVHCNDLRFSHQPGSNYDEALLDFFMTGAHCTSATTFGNCDISNVVVSFLKKFTDLKSGDESQMVLSIQFYGSGRVVEMLKANYAELIVKEEKCGVRTMPLLELINNDIGKQLRITTRTISSTMYNETEFLLEIRNL